MGKEQKSDKVSVPPNSAASSEKGPLCLFPLPPGSVRPRQDWEPHRQDHLDHQDHQRHVGHRRPGHQGPARSRLPAQQGRRCLGQGCLRGEVRQDRAKEEEEAHWQGSQGRVILHVIEHDKRNAEWLSYLLKPIIWIKEGSKQQIQDSFIWIHHFLPE